MDNSKLQKFLSHYASRFMYHHETIDIHNYAQSLKMPLPATVELTIDTNALQKLVKLEALGAAELEEQELRSKNETVRLAYEHYQTLLKLCR